MPTYKIAPPLPSYPANLKDEDAAKLAPLYFAINTLSQQLNEATGYVSYAGSEKSSVSPLVYLREVNRLLVQATEAIPYGALMHLTESGGVISASLATSTAPVKDAHAICINTSGATVGQIVETVFLFGHCQGVTGTTFGTQYYLGAAGVMQNTAPTAVGTLVQTVAIGMGSYGCYLDIANTGKVN